MNAGGEWNPKQNMDPEGRFKFQLYDHSQDGSDPAHNHDEERSGPITNVELVEVESATQTPWRKTDNAPEQAGRPAFRTQTPDRRLGRIRA